MPRRRPRATSVALLASALTLGACHRAHVAPSSSAPPETAGTQRSTDEIRRDGNHLVGQRSNYLLQHSKNPVDWYPWGAEALDRAKREDKPIFLSIGYSSCHWCHVMEAEVFEKDDVAEFLNLHFISIKVDREERPDLDEAYMRALVSMTGGGRMADVALPHAEPAAVLRGDIPAIWALPRRRWQGLG